VKHFYSPTAKSSSSHFFGGSTAFTNNDAMKTRNANIHSSLSHNPKHIESASTINFGVGKRNSEKSNGATAMTSPKNYADIAKIAYSMGKQEGWTT
jgi:hypothetical protein